MKYKIKYFILGFTIIFFITSLWYKTLNEIYHNSNLSGEYTTMLNGYINLLMAIGILIVVIELVEALINKKYQD